MSRYIHFLILLMSVNSAYALNLNNDVIGDGTHNVPLLEFDTYISTAPIEGQIKLINNYERLEQVLANLYMNRIIAEEARALGLDADPRNAARIKNLIDRELTRLRLEALDAEPIPALDTAAREHYEAHRDAFTGPEQMLISHVLIAWDKRSLEEAQALAEDVRKQALQGADFGELADRYSEDPSVKFNHGDLGWQQRSKLEPTFAAAAFALPEDGSISEVVKTKHGFHIIVRHGHRPAGLRPFAQVKPGIEERLTKRIRNERREAYVQKIRSNPKLGVDKARLKEYAAEKLKSLELGKPELPL